MKIPVAIKVLRENTSPKANKEILDVSLPVCLSLHTYLSIYLCDYLSFCLPVYLSVSLFICLPVFPNHTPSLPLSLSFHLFPSLFLIILLQ